MCGIAKMQNTDVWKLPKFKIPLFRKSQNLEFQCLEKGKMQNSNLWKTPKSKLQSLEKAKFGIPMFGKSKNLDSQCLEKSKF